MNYYDEIKTNLINNEVYKRVKDYSKNRSDLDTYYKVGKLLAEAGKHYGEGIIKEYSKRLELEIGKKYSVRILYKMLKYYNYLDSQKMPTVSAKMSWSHYDELLKFCDNDKISYYISLCEKQNLSVRQLREKIRNEEYERLPIETKNKLINKEETNIKDLVPNPILIRNKNNVEVINEKVLHQLILEDIESFMKELGSGYAFVGNEYKIKIGNEYNFIDLLLFNYEFNCFVVIELKVTELKKENIGQIEVYMNYIDENVKKIEMNKTIGIIIVRKNNEYVIKYCSDKRIISRNYELV